MEIPVYQYQLANVLNGAVSVMDPEIHADSVELVNRLIENVEAA